MTGLRFRSSEVVTSRCPRRTILNALERAKILLSDRDLHGITPIGLNGERILAAACGRALSIATHRAEGRFSDAIREAEAFLPPIVGPQRGRWDVLLLDTDALLDTDHRTLLSKVAAMAILGEAYEQVGKPMDATHMKSYLRLAAHAVQLREFATV
ncbi:hypothetical protein J4450_06205 [Candidatus Micrarchaeota archaeon]|nr:hypothetical protein [Candidatus Micrarchaeota archaeon]